MAGRWRKARRSQAGGNNCVETRLNGGMAEIRDSKSTASGILAATPAEFTALLRLSSEELSDRYTVAAPGDLPGAALFRHMTDRLCDP